MIAGKSEMGAPPFLCGVSVSETGPYAAGVGALAAVALLLKALRNDLRTAESALRHVIPHPHKWLR